MFLIVHNPLSSNKKSRKTTKKYVRFFQKKQIPFIIRSTLKIKDLNKYLSNRPKISDLLLLGGDGSINYFINNTDLSKINQNIYLAKSGSGNDYLRTLKKTRPNQVYIGKAILNGKTLVNFANGCGLGFDGLVCHYVNNDEKKNKITYLKNVFKSIVKYKPQEVKVKVDGKTFEFKKTYLVAIQNGRYFGGGMKAAPHAHLDDKDLYVLVVHSLSKWLLQILLMSIYPGIHTIFKKYVTIFSGQSIQVEFEKENYFQADGEVIESVKNIDVSTDQTHALYAFNKKKY
jgi:diacylglycerol kinase family enzyme